MRVAVAARVTDEYDTTRWRIVHQYVEQGLAWPNGSGMTRIAIDESAS